MSIFTAVVGAFAAGGRWVAGVWGVVTGHSVVGAVLLLVGLAAVAGGITVFERRRGLPWAGRRS
jgi:hypothetical protein